MRKPILLVVLIFSLAVCLALASCGENTAKTTAEMTTEAPATTAAPATTETPATTAAQKTTEAPATTVAPATTETPATTAVQKTTEAPATTDAPATTAAPQTTEAPSTCEHLWDEGRVTRDGTCDSSTKIETKGEIMFTCTICGATKTEETDGHDWTVKVIDSATCVKTGTALYTCKRCKTKETRTVPINLTAHRLESGAGRIVSVPTPIRNGEREWICTICEKVGKTEEVTYADYTAEVNTIREKVNGFDSSDFGTGSIRTDLGGSYAKPPVNPTKGQHPRVLFTSDSIAGMNEELYDGRSKIAAQLYRKEIRNPTDGALAATAFDSTDTSIFRNIQTLALDYQLTGNKISGYNAIFALKNALKTLTNSWTGHDDVAHRYYGFAMYISACVYDWCYDLMTKTDRDQIVLGVQEKICKVGMTVTYAVGFPPTQADAVSGHGTGYMILRDYLSFAIAIYDEYPGWWDMIAGRFYEEYVPVREILQEAGMMPQGVSLYIRSKYVPELFSVWLIKAATGTFPYENEENMKQIARTIYSHELPGRYNWTHGVGFNCGDDHIPDGSFIDYGHVALFSSYVFNDATMRAQLEYNYGEGMNGCSYTDFSGDVTATATVSEYFICSSSRLQPAASRREGMDLILYNGAWMSQVIARNSWSDDQAAVLMKIGQRTVANHDHYDAGSFQIFYRELLAGDTGAYVKYHEAHHSYYHQATIAHNSILIYNPSKSSTNGGYYSGGQRQLGDANMSNWQNSKFKIGEVTGYAAAYADAEETTPTYAYIAGDIAAAYDSETASEVTRRMLTVFDTGNADVPMYFFVFDNITAKDASYKKTFLLHTVTEPTVEGNVVTEVVGSGKLVLQNVVGKNVTITKRGGEGQNYLVNKGSVDNYVQLDNANNRDDEYWGRVEISPATGSKTDQLLNVMYVCDADNDPGLNATAISTNLVKGAVIGNTVAAFVISATRRDTQLAFNAPGSGTMNYYVSGMAAGTWKVTVGSQTKTVTVTEESGLLVFTAPAGLVTLTPQ